MCECVRPDLHSLLLRVQCAGLGMVRKVVEHRHRALPSTQTAPVEEYLSLLLAPLALGRKHVYDQDRASKMGVEYICDLEHNLGYGPSPGPLLPCLDSHPSIYSYERRRLAIPAELLSAQGKEAMPDLCGQRKPSELGLILQELGDRNLKSLLGNSVHVPSYAAWFLYVLSNCMRREELTPRLGLTRLSVSKQSTKEFEDEC